MEPETVKKNEIKAAPELRFREFEGIWQKIKLGEFLTFKNGLNSDKEKYGRGIKFINVLDIINNDFITYDRIIGSVEVTEKELEKNSVTYGDVLFQRSSETREEVGQSNVYLDRQKTAVFGGFVIRGKRIKKYNPLFIHNLLKTEAARKEITSKSGGSTRYNVGQETLSNVEITTTSLPEQQKIASFLSAVDKKIQQLIRKKELLETSKKGMMQQLFSQEIRFRNEEGNDYPEWEKKRIGQILKIGSGRDYKHLNKGEIPVFGTGGIMTYVNDYLYDGESVGIGRKGTINKPVFLTGKIWTVDTLFYTHSFNQVVPKFVFSLFQQINWIKHNEASGVPSLSKNTIENLKVLVPSIPEQQKIADFLSAIDKKIEAVSQQIEKTKSFKKGLLQQMFV